MMEVMQNIWAAIPSALKRFVGYGVASGIALAIVLAMYLFWGTGYLQERLGIMVTKEDLSEQTQDLAAASDEAITNVVNGTLLQYDQRMRDYLATERQLAKDTILQPILTSLEQLDKNQRVLQRSIVQMNGKMEDLPGAFDEKLARLMVATQASDNTAKLDELTQMIRQQQEELQLLRQEVQTGRKTSKVRM
jgi:mevalonate kinase